MITGAPECYTHIHSTEESPTQVKKSVDAWSLGCIFSEAAFWVVRGWNGLEEYRRRRKIETDRLIGFRDPYCFHDGYKALKVVRNLQQTLARDCRFSDRISAGSDLHSMINLMLQPRESRKDATELSDCAAQLMDRARSELVHNPRSLHASRNGQASLYPRQIPPNGPPRDLSSAITLPTPPLRRYTTPSLTSSRNVDGHKFDDGNIQDSLPVISAPHIESYHQGRIYKDKFNGIGNGKRPISQDDDPAKNTDPIAMTRIHFGEGKVVKEKIAKPGKRSSQHHGFSTRTTHCAHNSDENASNDSASTCSTDIAWILEQRRLTAQSSAQDRQIEILDQGRRDAEPRQHRNSLSVNSPVVRVPNPPMLTVNALREWRRQRKRFKRRLGKTKGKRLDGEHYMEELKERDHVRRLAHTALMMISTYGFSRCSSSMIQQRCGLIRMNSKLFLKL